MGLFSSLRLGSEALRAQQTGIEVAGHNLANINTDGYTKQRVNMASVAAPAYSGASAGRGVQVQSITRQVSVYLINSIRDQGTSLQSLDQQSHVMQQVESIIGELSESDLSTGFSKFFDAAQNLNDNPKDAGFRENYLQEAKNLAAQFNSLGERLQNLQTTINDDVANVVKDANVLSQKISELNQAIVRNESAQPNVPSQNANDLRDQRDEAIRQLAEIVNINVSEQTNGSVVVSVTGDTLIAGNSFNSIDISQSVVNGNATYTPIFSNNLAPLVIRGGTLHGLIEARDTLVGGIINDLDILANGFAKEVNNVQSTGFGLKGYSSVTAYEKVGAHTNVSLNTAGFSTAVEDGGFNIEVRQSDGTVTPVYIQVDADGIGFDTTLESLRDEINSKLTGAGFTDLSANIDSNGFISLSSTSSSLTFNFSDDSSGILNTLGWGTLYNGDGAQGLKINSLVDSDIDFLAAGSSTSPTDNTNIAKVIAMRDSKVMSNKSETIEEYYRAIVSNTAATTARISNNAMNQAHVVSSLQSERLSVSGVNTDEELVSLMTYQRSYQGAARFISVVDELLDTLINGIF